MKDVWHKTLNFFGLADDLENDLQQDYEEYEEETMSYLQKPLVKKLQRDENGERVASLRSISTPKARVHILEPKSFNDAQKIADKFRSRIPVIINLQVTDQDLSKRLIDFVSGLTYGLNGEIQRVAEKVFLLTPSNFEVSAEEKRMLQEKGFFNQF
ncbi:MAG: cell division protein SepF [Actinobacteria bacterium]|nr:cell division protein SepF [Actinomycetota bacterium]